MRFYKVRTKLYNNYDFLSNDKTYFNVLIQQKTQKAQKK